jgi:type II secretory pathway pseudopilin PulG
MSKYLKCGRGFDDVRGAAVQRIRPALTLVELLVIVAIIGVLVALLLPNVRTAREPARRNQCMNNLKQIALAIQNYSEIHGELPPAYTTDESGKPLHSWRTLILPFLEQKDLYEAIDLNKPWDDPANAAAFKTPVDTYQCPSNTDSDNRTTYLAVVTPQSCFRPGDGVSVSEISDPVKETMMVIEVESEHAIPWMSPADADEKLVLALGDPKTRSPHPGGAVTAFMDGRVQFLGDELPADQRRAMISIAGNDSAALEATE